VAAHPELLGDQADEIIRQLAETAYGAGQRDVSLALREIRLALGRIRSGGADRELRPARPERGDLGAAAPPVAPDAQALSSPDVGYQISNAAYQMLLGVCSRDELIAITREHPALLEEWAGAELAARADAALDEGNERLARTIEERREALAELRAEVGGPDVLARAAQALLEARDEDEIALALTEYPILLTDVAQDALLGLAAGARAQGDANLAEYAVERRAMLRNVRAGLEAS
jgi:hypothetical protein